MSKRPLIALTGATGFVGRAVCERLLSQGYKVKALIRPAKDGQPRTPLSHQNLTWIEGALGQGLSEEKLCKNADIIIHMAGLITARSWADYERVNAHAVGSLAKQAQKSGAGRFIYLSSLAASQPQLSHYARSKRQGEQELHDYQGQMEAIILRAPAVFGYGDVATAPFYKLIQKGFLPVPGGRNWRGRKLSLIHVDDLADFITGPCLVDDIGSVPISVATRACLTWPQFASACEQALGRKIRVIPLPLSALYSVALITNVTKCVWGKGHLTLGKLREFLYRDWSIAEEFQTGSSLQKALKVTINET